MMRKFEDGQQVKLKRKGKIVHGYIYANTDNYAVGYWDSTSNTEKVLLGVNEQDISELICSHTGKVCDKLQKKVNYCKHCDKSKYTSYINPFKNN